jgi:putative transcriptional regulator
MIVCHLSMLMSREKLRVSDVSKATGLNRSTVSAICKGTCTRVDLSTIDQLCSLFKCEVRDIFEYVPDNGLMVWP